MNCFVCNKELESVDGGGTETVYPYNALAFTTHGHYGSQVFDPVTRPIYLKIVVCDVCMFDRAHKVYGNGADEFRVDCDRMDRSKLE